MARKLVSVVRLDDVVVHPNADSLELAIVGGWQCCVQKGEFKKGDLAIYCEIDSLLPLSDPDFAFLEARKESLKLIDGSYYSRIKTIKLRKELSQGLVIPIPERMAKVKEGEDLTSKFGVLKYEKPEAGVNLGSDGVPGKSNLLGRLIRKIATKGATNMMPWPTFIQKTDQERVQNMSNQYAVAAALAEEFEVTYKLDGSSWTAFYYVEKTAARELEKSGVCSRNYQLRTEDVVYSKTDQVRNWIADLLMYNVRFFKTWKFKVPPMRTGIKVSEDNFVRMYKKLDIYNKLKAYQKQTGLSIALQGEMVGPGIQGNFEGNKELEVYIYNVWIIGGGYMMPDEAKALVESLGLNYVPIYNPRMKLPATVQDVLKLADGPSGLQGKYREGLVYKSLTRDFSFKTISNAYLLKNE